MTYSLSNNCTKNYYNRTLTVQVIVEDVVTWNFLRHSVHCEREKNEPSFCNNVVKIAPISIVSTSLNQRQTVDRCVQFCTALCTNNFSIDQSGTS